MFLGEYNHSIDEKGRLIIPSKFRFELGEAFFLTRGLDGCLCAYPQSEWEALHEKLKSLPFTNKDARKIIRFFASGADMFSLDRQGRILVPAALRKYAGLDKDVVVTGNLDRVEIWDKARWEENSDFDDMDSIEEGLRECGITL